MTKTVLLFLAVIIALVVVSLSCRQAERPQPPVAGIDAKTLEIHGHERVDDYYWMKERENPEVISYLAAENAYTQKIMAPTEPLQQEIFDEITGRIKKNDESVPYLDNGYVYYTRFEEGREYAIYCRREGSMESDEEIMLDANLRAEGQPFYSARGLEVSSGNDVLVFAEDTTGRRIYTLRFKDLSTGELLDDTIEEVTGNVAWAEDNLSVFYTKQDLETLRPFQVMRHQLGGVVADDVLVFEELDDTFGCFVKKSKSKQYIIVHSGATVSDEALFLRADDPTGTFEIFLARERGHEYSIDHLDGRFYVRTNADAANFRLMSTPVNSTDRRSWQEVIPNRADIYLVGFELFEQHLVAAERKDGLSQLRIMPWSGEGEHYLDFGEPTYDAWIEDNPSLDTTVLRYGYSSLTTPKSVFDYDMVSREKILRKQDEVLGGFDSSNYRAERLYASARDGLKVPVSIVYRVDARGKGPSPLVLYAYGSYGASMDAKFDIRRLSLLDRGFIYAIAHVRGGQEYGRQWYEDGKLLKKMNTFNDFIDCGGFLIEEGLTTSDQMFAMGGSAGGLLMGVVVNLRPELFKGVVARVPFVDVITTMLDPEIPLTTSEYDEWGNPNDREFFDYMLAYSPYDQVEAKDYPAMLVTAGLHDSQVQYWEPAKWVARLRAMKTDDNLLLLHTNMDAGHGGASGRFRRFHETALTYAFMIDLL